MNCGFKFTYPRRGLRLIYSHTCKFTATPTFIFCIHLLLHEGPRAKIDQLYLIALQVNQDILVLHIPMEHTLGQAILHCLQHLLKEVFGGALADCSLLGDVVKQVDVFLGTLHDDEEFVLGLKVVQELDDVFLFEVVQEGDLLGHTLVTNLREGGRGEMASNRATVSQ